VPTAAMAAAVSNPPIAVQPPQPPPN
jgi:hypothetical protein